MTTIRSFRDLEAWQIAMHTAVAPYRLTLLLPASERFELARQMRRAATSVPSKLAEGQARTSSKSFRHFLGIALGSTAELDTGRVAVALLLAVGLCAQAIHLF
jgi:four helix bundle protein